MASILGFLVILAPLVIVHELGHFFFARLFGVRADVFSIGFGPKIWRRKIGETEYCVSAIPLGGYVKLFGEEPGVELSPAERPRALQHQAAWKRFFIFFGGPLFNFLWAILVFMVILALGEPQLKSIIGRVLPGSEAEVAGFRSGDRVRAVDGKPLERFHDLLGVIQENPGKTLHFDVLRSSTPKTITAIPSSEEGFSPYGEIKQVGRLDGILPAARAPLIGVSDPASIAARAGLRTGDKIARMEDRQIRNWEDFESAFHLLPLDAKAAHLELSDGRKVELPLPRVRKSPAQDWGLHSSELFVKETLPSSPAQAAGLQMGDRVSAVSGMPVTSFFAMKDAIQEAGEKTGVVEFRWERAGKVIESKILPTKSTERDPALKKKNQFTIGVLPMLEFAEGETILERETNPIFLVSKSIARVADLVWKNLVSIGKMFKGEVSVGTLGGPILIGKIAGDSLERGLIAFLSTMAILSVGLGILNVLPVPVLDGGHLLLLVVEVIRGKPLSVRQIEIAQQVGLSLILLLMVVVMRNDLSRLPLFN